MKFNIFINNIFLSHMCSAQLFSILADIVIMNI